MAKQPQRGREREREKERGAKIGKGKVTAVQVAFMVEQYLEDNNYTNALEAFRSDAAELFGKMKKANSANAKGKKTNKMKGLMGLGEILDEYISLKEQKLLLFQEKQRLDATMLGFHNLFTNYYYPNSSPTQSQTQIQSQSHQTSSPPLVPPQFVAPTPQFLPFPLPPPALTPVTGTMMNTSQAVMTPSESNAITNFSTPVANSSHVTASHNKRKASSSVPNALPALKKPFIEPSSLPLSSSKIVTVTSNMQEKVELVNNSIAKSLFKPIESISNASPETPQTQKSIMPVENPSMTQPNTQCSIVSSERIIVSPLKGGAAYYSVERSYQFTSPLKPDGRKSGKRDHVKGKLNFDNTDANAGPSEAVVGSNDDKVSSSPSTYSPSSSSDGGENLNQFGDGFDFDFSEFDILNQDFQFSDLLVDLDLDCEGLHSQSSPEQNNPTPRLNNEAGEDEMTHIITPDSSKLTILNSPDANIQGGNESVTSFRAITKRVKIVSPVKAMRKK
ncbi:myosin-M heavy protein [Rhynchospora pubera]|uniref:Myosin-M heavy protein n=1 Tax=Rhynchospora pubera TaxID=906938 RepID=A0AAV8E8K3_9POAL|nr:myosin-M heavy protein [Rhynchospora pubera]